MRNQARFLLSKSQTIAQYKKAKSMADLVSYSFKTNNDVGKILEDTDSMYTLHSIESADMIKDMSRIWYLAQAWCTKELDMVFQKGMNKFIVDNEKDLQMLLDYIEKHDKKIWLLLRIRLKEHTIHTGKYFVYGMKKDMVKKWLPVCKENRKIEKLGLHFHRKTQNVSEWNILEELSAMFTKEDFKDLSYVNIGGGLPAEYKNFRSEVMNNIFKKIKKLRDYLNSIDVEMILEPGRFLAASPVILEAEIMNIYDNNIVVNCSVWNSAMDTFIQHIRLLVEGEKESGTAYTIKGQSPDSMDILRYRVFLENPVIGDKIRFLNAGAYNFHSNFCNLPKIETVIVE